MQLRDGGRRDQVSEIGSCQLKFPCQDLCKSSIFYFQYSLCYAYTCIYWVCCWCSIPLYTCIYMHVSYIYMSEANFIAWPIHMTFVCDLLIKQQSTSSKNFKGPLHCLLMTWLLLTWVTVFFIYSPLRWYTLGKRPFKIRYFTGVLMIISLVISNSYLKLSIIEVVSYLLFYGAISEEFY